MKGIRCIFSILVIYTLSAVVFTLLDWNTQQETINVAGTNSSNETFSTSFVLPTTTTMSVGTATRTSVHNNTTSITTTTDNSKKGTIAWAVSITGISGKKMYDHAAVVHQSIRLASRNSNYNYKMIAFVHPDAIECKDRMEKLGYEVQIRDIPFNPAKIQNQALHKSQEISCCGFKEYLKLYPYTMLEFPIVVHLDLDTIVLKPLDDLFDLMIEGESFDQKSKIKAMWLKPEEFPSKIDFIFTRDYNMVDPPKRQVHQIGVQGGFLIIRPNRTDFDRLVEIILSGGKFLYNVGWGGKFKKYGGYYGEGTVQGLASYYYGEFAKNRSLEVSRCYFNAMVDNPKSKQMKCRTLETECEDCRKTNIEDIYTAHFTVCGKPQWCPLKGDWWTDAIVLDPSYLELCMKLFRQWHYVRKTIEDEWQQQYPDYEPNLFFGIEENTTTKATIRGSHLQKHTFGHCKAKRKYLMMSFPQAFMDNSSTAVLIG